MIRIAPVLVAALLVLSATGSAVGADAGPTDPGTNAPDEREFDATLAPGDAPDAVTQRTRPDRPSAVTVSGASDESIRSPSAVDLAARDVTRYESDDMPPLTVVRDPAAHPAVVEAVPAVSAPTATKITDGDSRVSLYTWSERQGLVLDWTLTVADERVVHRRARVAAVGVNTTPNFEAFAPPEGAVVVNETLAPASNHVANISVSRNYVVANRPYTLFPATEISLTNFGAGNENVTIDITVDGNRVANRSGVQPVLRTDASGDGTIGWTPVEDPYSGRACIEATSPSASRTWCITDPNPDNQNDTYHEDDADGLLTIEETQTIYVGSGGDGWHVEKDFVFYYTDQILQNSNDGPRVKNATIDAVADAFTRQSGWGFYENMGGDYDNDGNVPVYINDGTFKFHGARDSSAAFWGMTRNDAGDRRINYNANYGSNASRHAMHIMAHEHFHLVEYAYAHDGFKRGNPLHTGGNWDWYLEGMARFVETKSDPSVVHDPNSLFFADNINGVNGYRKNPDRDLRNYSYDYALFWMHMYNATRPPFLSAPSHPAYDTGGMNALERFLDELQEEGSTPGVDGPDAIDAALGPTNYTGYADLLGEFHVATARATYGNEERVWHTREWIPSNQTYRNYDWGDHLRDPAVDREVRPSLSGPESFDGRVKPYGVDYLLLEDSNPAVVFDVNRTDFETATVRANASANVVRGPVQLSAGHELVRANNTVIRPDDHDSVVVVVSSLGNGTVPYNVTARDPAESAYNSLDREGERAVYVVPIGVARQNNPGTHPYAGPLYVGVDEGTDRNLGVDVELASGTAPAASARPLATPGDVDVTERVAPVFADTSSVWRIEVNQTGPPPGQPKFWLYSNYLDRNGLNLEQVFDMPTDVEVSPYDDQAGDKSNPNQVSMVVHVENGDRDYEYRPFPSPGPDHFRITVGGVPVAPSDVSVNELASDRYIVKFTPPTRASAGPAPVCVAFRDTKYGVTEVSDDNCGTPIVYTDDDPFDGSSITIDTSVIDVVTVTPVVNLHVDTAMNDDEVSVVSVGADGAVTAVPAQPAGSDENRDAMKAGVEETFASAEAPAEPTAVAAGLEASLVQLRESDAPSRATVLVSDGSVDDEAALEEVVGAYAEAGIAIHTVAVGEEADRERLREIAGETGGEFSTAYSTTGLHAALDEFDAGLGDDGAVASETGVAAPDRPVEWALPVDESLREVALRVELSGAAANAATVRLRRPNGEPVAVTAETATGTTDPSVSYDRSGSTVIYRLRDVEPGRWTYVVDSPEGEVAVDSRVAAETTTTFDAVANATSSEAGNSVRLAASLVGAGGPIEGAEVVATVVGPDGERREVPLEERGAGGYAATIGSGETGDHAVTVRATGEGALARVGDASWTTTPARDPPVVRAGDATVATGSTARVPVVLDAAPTGFRSASVRVCLGDPIAAPVTVEAGDLGAVQNREAPDGCVAFDVADAGGAVGPGDAPATLGTVVYDRTAPGRTDVRIAVSELVDDDGAAAAPLAEPGTLAVSAGESTRVEVVLDGAPHGLDSYNLTVDGDPPVVGVEAGVVGAENFDVVAGGPGTRTATVAATDLTDAVGETEATLPLATIEYAGDVDVSALSLSVHELHDDNGTHDHDGPIANDTAGSGDGEAGEIDHDRVRLRLVGAALFDAPLPGTGGDGPPTDPDADGRYEDVDGDGEAAFRDAVALAFADTDGLTVDQRDALDFDRDGDVDFDDAIELAFGG
jgi:hypothetical protein